MSTIQNQMDALYLKQLKQIELPEDESQKAFSLWGLGVKGGTETASEYSKGEAIAEAASMGIKDTFRGIKQVTGHGLLNISKFHV